MYSIELRDVVLCAVNEVYARLVHSVEASDGINGYEWKGAALLILSGRDSHGIYFKHFTLTCKKPIRINYFAFCEKKLVVKCISSKPRTNS